MRLEDTWRENSVSKNTVATLIIITCFMMIKDGGQAKNKSLRRKMQYTSSEAQQIG
jgi:hypothetical protein